MAYLIDTSILGRLANTADASHPAATRAVIGKRVHDARLVAVCHVHQVTHLLTFNIVHFTPMAGHGPGVVIVDPASI